MIEHPDKLLILFRVNCNWKLLILIFLLDVVWGAVCKIFLNHKDTMHNYHTNKGIDVDCR